MDSKLFFGSEIGCITYVIPLLRKHYPHSTLGWEYIRYVNTQLPKGVFLDIWYPHITCPESEMRVHLNIMDDRFEYSAKEMKKILKRANIEGYAYVLGLLRLPYQKPTIYTKHYNYNV